MKKVMLAIFMAGLMLITVFSVCFTVSAACAGTQDAESVVWSIKDGQYEDVSGEGGGSDDGISDTRETLFIYVDAGKDIITYADQPTVFKLNAFCPTGDEIKYAWDFDGDGIYDFFNGGNLGQIAEAAHIYKKSGTYTVKIKATDVSGNVPASYGYINVYVKTGSGNQQYVEESEGEGIKPQPAPAPDGITEKYAVMINGGYEERFWIDVEFTYKMLIEDYSFTSDNIYLLNYDGENPDGENPDNMIDFAATKSNIEQVFNTLAGIIDEDDILFVWIDDHGRGYYGPGHRYYGFSYSPIDVDPGDEHDYLESDFKLCSFFTSYPSTGNHGMGIWKYRENGGPRGVNIYRRMYVSTFEGVYFLENNCEISDDDIWIEEFYDHLAGDFNANGFIEEELGEVLDFDGDGNPPWQLIDGDDVFDEDDWGAIDRYWDDVTELSTRGFSNYIIFDNNTDNHVSIDVNYCGGVPEVDGCDLDNEGLFDGIDVNDDGDMDDWVSIDEFICVPGEDISDDDLKTYIDLVNPKVTIVFLEPCFSGGFIWDLSAPKRVICTATVEELPSYGNSFVRGFTSAFHGSDRDGNQVDADYDGDGDISITEAFNYASTCTSDNTQYDDNGDGIGHAYPIPNGGDGELGSRIFLHGDFFVAGAGGPYYGEPGEAIQFTGFASGGIEPYEFEWGFGDGSISFEQNPTHHYITAGTYTAKLTVKDSTGDIASGTTQVTINTPPNKPSKPSGKRIGKTGTTYTYSSSTTDPDGDQVWYWWDWGDGKNSGWLGPYNSGQTASASHTWDEKGSYQVKVKAKDVYDAESDWSDPLSISMSKNKESTDFNDNSNPINPTPDDPVNQNPVVPTPGDTDLEIPSTDTPPTPDDPVNPAEPNEETPEEPSEEKPQSEPEPEEKPAEPIQNPEDPVNPAEPIVVPEEPETPISPTEPTSLSTGSPSPSTSSPSSATSIRSISNLQRLGR